MSASNKKQQRKAALAEGLTQKQLKDRAEAQAAKRNQIIYTAVGILCAVAAIALLAWNHMSSNRGDSHKGEVAATVGGANYTVEDLQYYYANIRNTYYQYASYGYVSFDPNTDDGAQWYNEEEGKTYADFFRENALSSLKRTAALCTAAKADGYALSEEGQQSIDAQLDSVDVTCVKYNLTRDSFFSQQYGISEKAFVRNLTNDTLANEYYDYHQENISYDDNALKEYYDTHTDDLDSYSFRSFFISGAAPDPVDANGNPMTDADGNTITATEEEKAVAMAAAKAQADAAAAEIRSAADKDKAFAEAAPKYVAETSKASYEASDRTLSENVLGNTLTQNGSALAAWLMDSTRKAGDLDVVEAAGNGYYVVMFKSRALNDDPTVDIRHILIRAELADGATEPTQEAMDAAKAEAQSLLDQWNAGDKTAESFGELATENSDDGGSSSNGGLYDHVYKGQMVPNFNDWCFDAARKEGDAGLVENNGDGGYYGWHVIYFQGSNEPYWKHAATESKQATDQNEWMTGLSDAAEVVEGDGMKYVGSENTAVPTPSASPAASPAESQAVQ